MKLSDDYLLRQVYNDWVLFPVGENISQGRHPIILNETGKLIVDNLLYEIEYDSLIANLAKELEATQEEIPKLIEIISPFLEKLKENCALI